MTDRDIILADLLDRVSAAAADIATAATTAAGDLRSGRPDDPPDPDPPPGGTRFTLGKGRIWRPDGTEWAPGGMAAALAPVDGNGAPFNYAHMGLPPSGHYDLDGTVPWAGGGDPGQALVWQPGLGPTVMRDHYAEAKAWAQEWWRMICLPRGHNDMPTPELVVPQYVDRALAHAKAGFVVVMTSFLFGKGNKDITDLGHPSVRDTEYLFDAVVEATSGSDPAHARIWLSLNEPWTGLVDDGYRRFVAHFVERANDRGFKNLFLAPTAHHCQDFAGGEHDDYNWLKQYGNVALDGHAYGSNTAGLHTGKGTAPYTWATFDHHLQAFRDRGLPLLIGEYGQARKGEVGNAGPDEWNRRALQYLAVGGPGQPPLAVKHRLPSCHWAGSAAEETHWNLFALTEGRYGLADRWWRVASPDDPRLSEAGRAHWRLSHRLAELVTA